MILRLVVLTLPPCCSDVKVFVVSRKKMLQAVNERKYNAFLAQRTQLREQHRSAIQNNLKRLIPGPKETREDADPDDPPDDGPAPGEQMLPMLPKFHPDAPGGVVSRSLEEHAPKHLPVGHPAGFLYNTVLRRFALLYVP